MTSPGHDRIDTLLKWSVRSMVLAFVVCVVGVAFDGREVLGAPVWLKPLKFSVSIGIIVGGVRWLRRQLRRDRWVDGAALVAAGALTVEQALIALQASRGVRSHFNGATAFDTQVYGLMGVFVGAVFVAGLVVAWRSFRHRELDGVMRAVVTSGSSLTLLGMSVGVAMTMPLPDQRLSVGVVGAHSIGGADGGPGLPLLGWSTQFGDLRVAHFVGLHAFHALVVLAAILHRRSWSTERARTAVVMTSAALGTSTVLLAGQALTGRSVASPSSALIAAAAIVVALGAARLPRPRNPSPTATVQIGTTA